MASEPPTGEDQGRDERIGRYLSTECFEATEDEDLQKITIYSTYMPKTAREGPTLSRR
jgi:hypothetical protein